MPELQPEITQMRSREPLNEAQLRHLSISCQHIDKLLTDAEHILHEAASPSPFPRHIIDVTPAQTRALEDHIRRIREQLLRTLAWQQMKPEASDVPATRALLVLMTFIDITIEELKPNYMRGSGPVSQEAADELNGVVYELRSAAQSMERYIRQEFGTNLESRLKDLERGGHDVALLRQIEEIITRHGLVEFRSRIASLASRLEDDNLEVALFGRVSSGKSSLLNALLGTNVLPVGVNPITAVPTKLRYGKELRAAVAYASGREDIVPLEEFADLITEQGNPGNERSVVRALVEVPASRLKQGIVLVDTPGLGSLAKRGAAETMAYLPSCDLALLLIDSGNALNDEDIGTLRILYESGIPSLVLLSKSDLLAQGDLHRVTGYIEAQLQRELGASIRVHPVSALAQYSVLLDHFFERELFPRFEQARSLREASVTRKIGALRESVIAALETVLDRGRRGKGNLQAADTNEVEAQLRRVSGEVGEQRTFLDHAFLELGERPDVILEELAEMVVARIFSGGNHAISAFELSEWTHNAVQRRVDQALSRSRDVIRKAIDTLRQVAKQMGSSEAPTQEDAEMLMRDAPRFEIGVIPGKISLAHWKLLGVWLVRLLARKSLRDILGPSLKHELHQYGRAISHWSEQMTRKEQALMNSYADAYRAQVNRISGVSPEAVASPEMEHDLALLLRSGMAATEDGAEKSLEGKRR
jgi:GTP-binding protein EngB required for normal cell division